MGLKYAGVVLTVEKVEKEGDKVKHIIAKQQVVSNDNKPKAFVHWVSKPVSIHVRLYERL